MAPLIKAGACAILLLVPASWAVSADAPEGGKSAPRLTRDATWSLRLPKEEKVAYRGVASFDAVGLAGGQMLYPAPNVVGLLAAVLTHGVVVETVKSKERQKAQEEADKILEPYQPVLGEYRHRDLMRRGLQKVSEGRRGRLIEFSDKPGTGWRIDSEPVFSLTQDQRAIVLDNVISMYPPGDAPAPAYRNTVRVISVPREGQDLVASWIANGGEKVKEESSLLFAESLEIALDDAIAGPVQDDVPQKTIRYFEGGKEKMERGHFVGERCDRILLRTLRGSLMSVPPRRSPGDASAGHCAGQGKPQ
jgi:hypothetical protein